MFRWRSKTSLVAVDRGACSLRAIQFSFAAGNPRIIHWLNAEQPLTALAPAGTADEAAPAWQVTPAAALDQFDTRRTGLLIGADDVDYCLLKVPDAVWTRDPGELADAIRWEVGQQLSRPADEAELAAWPLPGPMGGGSNAMAVAAPRNTILSLIDSLGPAGTDCESVEPAAPAFIRACRVTARNDQDHIWGVLDLGYSAHRLYLAVNDAPVFARHVRGAGHAWTQLIARELRTEYAVAEHYKRKAGIGTDARGHRSFAGPADLLDESALPGVLLAVLKASLTDMTSDIERAFSFVMEQYPRHQAGSLILAGAGSRMPGLAEWLNHTLGVPVAPANAQGTINLPLNHPMAQPTIYAAMAGCVGLALGEVDS